MRILFFLVFMIFVQSVQAKNCTYEFDVEKSVVSGTGFKFTDKKAVKAQFLKVTLNKNEKKNSVKELLDGLIVTVDLMALDSGDALRDKNLRETFFAAILGNAEAKVEVKEIKKKKLKTVLHLNEKSLPIAFKYSIKDGVLEAKGSFDALKFAMEDSMVALQKRCGSLHTGADGKSKTWSDFDLAVKAVTRKTCK